MQAIEMRCHKHWPEKLKALYKAFIQITLLY